MKYILVGMLITSCGRADVKHEKCIERGEECHESRGEEQSGTSSETGESSSGNEGKKWPGGVSDTSISTGVETQPSNNPGTTESSCRLTRMEDHTILITCGNLNIILDKHCNIIHDSSVTGEEP